jgi:hypothetical protein
VTTPLVTPGHALSYAPAPLLARFGGRGDLPGVLGELTTSAPPEDREVEAAKARARLERRRAA